MAELMLVLHCSSADAEAVAEAIRSIVHDPLHRREEAVLGRDFSDAGTHEQVSGVLRRTAYELIVEDTMVPAIVAAVTDARRKLPVRWHSVPVLQRGRMA